MFFRASVILFVHERKTSNGSGLFHPHNVFSFFRFFICKVNNNWSASLLIEYSKLFADNIHQLSDNKNFNIKFEMEIEEKILFYSVSF